MRASRPCFSFAQREFTFGAQANHLHGKACPYLRLVGLRPLASDAQQNSGSGSASVLTTVSLASASVLTTVSLVSNFVYEKTVGSASVLTTISLVNKFVYEKVFGSVSVLTTVSLASNFVYEKVVGSASVH